MSSPIQTFLDAMDRELHGTVSDEARAEILAELRDHLEDSACDFRTQGSLSPEADAVADFGQAKRVGQELAAERNRKQFSMAEKAVLVLALLSAGVPVAVDLGVDLSSWLTGSDFLIYWVYAPVAVWCFALFIASIRCRRLLTKQIAGIVMACGFVALVVGGFSRAAQPGNIGTQTRGTAYRRMNGLLSERDGIGRIQVVQDKLEAGMKAFSSGELGVFKQQGGYIVPQIDPQGSQVYGGPGMSRYRYMSIEFGSTASLAEAAKLWAEKGPEFVKYTDDGIAGNRAEAAELLGVVHASWAETVRREFLPRGTFTAMGLVVLIGANLLGTGIGFLFRGRRRRGTA